MALLETQSTLEDDRTPLLREHHQNETQVRRTMASASDGEGNVQDHGSPSQQPHRRPGSDSPYLLPISKAKFWFIFGPVLLQYFVAMFDNTLMASSHPVITSYFNASNSASWLSTAFMLTSTAFQPIYGRVSDTIGRRPVYLFALVVFIFATAWCAAAPTIESFIAARAIAGFGAGGIVAMGGIMTNDLVRIEVRGTYQAYINLLYGSGSACGAAFGGFLCDSLGWRYTFAIQIPPVTAILVCAFLAIPSDMGPQLAKRSQKPWWQIVKEFDLAGSFFLACTTGLLILGLNLGGNVLPWSHPLVISSLALALLGGFALLYVESRALHPVMPIAIVSTAPRASLVFCNFFSMIGINTVLFNAPLYFQAVKGDSPTVAGFRLTIPSALLTVCGVSCGFFLSYTGRMKPPQIVGAISMLIGGICLSSMWDSIPLWLSTIFVIPAPVGQGLMFPATTLAVLATTSVDDQAVMTSTLFLWRNLGSVMGVAISSLVLQNSLLAYLEKFITGEDKTEIITKVRKSVRAIFDLDEIHHSQATMAYSSALRVTFLTSVAFFVIVNCLLLPVRLPRLGRDKVSADVDEEEGEEQSEA